jgi:3-oxoacyl-[acyl-carrier protein] reductase
MAIMSKKILITGVCGKLGENLLKLFLKDDYFVVGVDIDESLLGDLRKNYPDKKLLLEECNLTDESQVERLFNSLMDNNFLPNVVINNAGKIVNLPICKYSNGKLNMHSYDTWKETICTNLDSAFLVTRKFIELSIKKRQFDGLVVSISSISSKGNVGQSAYSASKAALEALMMVCAKELGPLGLRFVSIAPGFIDVSSTRAALSNDQIQHLLSEIPLKKLGSVEDIYEAIIFSIKCKYLTANNLSIDGGLKI